MDLWPQSLRSVVNIVLTSRYAMWMGWGPELTFLYNDAYRPTLGLKHPWALGNPAAKVWAEIWRDVGPRIQTVLSIGEATYDEGLLLFLERSGFPEETYHTFSYSPLSDDRGHVNGMLCVVTEETERIIAERRMATLRDLASGLATAITETEVLSAIQKQLRQNAKDLPFTLTYLFDTQDQARLMCATGIEEGHPVAPQLVPSGPHAIWPAHDMLHRAVSRVMDCSSVAVPLPAGAWEKSPTHAAIVPIKQQAYDRPAGFLVVGLNPYRRYDKDYAGFVELVAGQMAAGIASARTHEAERRRAESLAELDRAKTAFFSNVSHEFRTPLTLMLGPVEDLLARPNSELPPENRQLLEVVHRGGLRLQQLVNTLLDFSRIEAGRTQASYQPTDLGTLTGELASSFRSAMQRAGLNFVVDCQPLSRAVYVDREMWEKVVLNLLSNAFKYTMEGSVNIRLADCVNAAELSVTDTGVGIPENELPHLFERFHRVEGTHGRTHEGTGIGLALVQELVKLHGGTVAVASTHGQGSTFTVSMPYGSNHLPTDRVESEPALHSIGIHTDTYVDEVLHWLPAGATDESGALVALQEPKGSSSARSRVLLADDNADMRNYVQRLLSARYEVLPVANGAEALAALHTHAPDLVLTDVMMPVLDGFGLLRALRANESTKTIPIILLSARAGEESRVEGLDAGADDYLVKPFTARELLARVEAHLSLARMRRQADQARRLSELRLGLALESSRMFAWEWDPVQDAVFGAGDMRSIFGGVVPTSAEGFKLVHSEDEPAHRSKFDQVRLHGGSYHSEFRIRRADTGEIAWLEERATAITDEAGHVQRVVGVIVDVTEHKAAEEQLQRKNEELTKVNQELEEFAYVASHDLQEPLRMVNIYTQLLLRGDGFRSDPKTAQYAEFVHQGVHRMEELIKDLLNYSRVVHQDQEEARAADLNQSLDEALSVLRVPMDETAAILRRDPLPIVWGDEKQLALVFQNLLSNALKYRSPNCTPHIEIKAAEKDGEWIVSVIDNGIGFHPHHALRIFGLFKRLHKDAYPGTGLGLAIAKRIVERYGGRIWGESQGEGRGATFSFSLPSVGR